MCGTQRDCFREWMIIDVVLFPVSYDVPAVSEQRALQFLVVVDVSVL